MAAPPLHPTSSRSPGRRRLESIFQADNQLLSDPAGTLEQLHRLGVARIRVFVPWGALGARTPIAPDALSHRAPANFDASDPGAYPAAGWAPYDAIVRDAAARGIAVYFTVAGPAPVWATQPGEPPGTASAPSPIGAWKPSAADFGAFMRAVGTRYSGHYPDPLHPGQELPRVSFWGIWNEPNLGIYIAPQAIDSGKLEVSPVYYRRIVDAAWSALQATGHGHDTILIGELAPDGATVGPVPGDFDMMAPLRFLRALYCVDSAYHQLRGLAASQRGCPTTAAGSARFVAEHPGLFHASGVADHPYSQGLPPNQPPPLEPDYAEFADIPNLETTLDRLQQAYGSSTRFPIYSTEFGEQTDPPEKLIRALPPVTAAYYMNWTEYLHLAQSADPLLRSISTRRRGERDILDGARVRQRGAKGHVRGVSDGAVSAGEHGPPRTGARGLGLRPPRPLRPALDRPGSACRDRASSRVGRSFRDAPHRAADGPIVLLRRRRAIPRERDREAPLVLPARPCDLQPRRGASRSDSRR